MKHPIILALMFTHLAGFSAAQTTPTADLAAGYSPLYILKGGGSQFAFLLGGGGDVALNSSRNLALRLEGDYVRIRSSGSTTPAMRLGVGIVYRFGGTRFGSRGMTRNANHPVISENVGLKTPHSY